LNRFQTTTQTLQDIKSINQTCLGIPPKDITLWYLFYTNVKTLATTNMFLKTHLRIHHHLLHKTYILIHVLISNYQQTQVKQLVLIHKCHWFNQNMLIELCVSDYVTLDGLVNGVDGAFPDYT
jgi:hypothetical protein